MIMMIFKFYFQQKILGAKLGGLHAMGVYWGGGGNGGPEMGGSSGNMNSM